MRNKPWILPVAVLAALGLSACGDSNQTETDQQAATEQEQQAADQDMQTAERDTSQQVEQETRTAARDMEQGMQNAMPGGEEAGEEIEAVKVAESEEYGQHLVSEDGRAVYLYFSDSEGRSNCTGKCAEMWPPVLAENGQPEIEDPSIDQSKLGTITRDDGSQQVTYDGHPLYFYAEDRGPGEASGQGKNNQWALVTAEGEPVQQKQRGSAQL